MRTHPNIIVKGHKVRVDQRHPESHPGYADARRAGEIGARTLKFESEGDRRDYERMVASNPNNVYGLPAFYPPLKVRSFMNDAREEYRDEQKLLRERLRQRSIRDIELLCKFCGRVTVHSISPRQCFCKTCGSTSRLRSKMS